MYVLELGNFALNPTEIGLVEQVTLYDLIGCFSTKIGILFHKGSRGNIGVLRGYFLNVGKGEKKGVYPESLAFGSYWVSKLPGLFFLTPKAMWVPRYTVLLIVVMDV